MIKTPWLIDRSVQKSLDLACAREMCVDRSVEIARAWLSAGRHEEAVSEPNHNAILAKLVSRVFHTRVAPPPPPPRRGTMIFSRSSSKTSARDFWTPPVYIWTCACSSSREEQKKRVTTGETCRKKRTGVRLSGSLEAASCCRKKKTTIIICLFCTAESWFWSQRVDGRTQTF